MGINKNINDVSEMGIMNAMDDLTFFNKSTTIYNKRNKLITFDIQLYTITYVQAHVRRVRRLGPHGFIRWFIRWLSHIRKIIYHIVLQVNDKRIMPPYRVLDHKIVSSICQRCSPIAASVASAPSSAVLLVSHFLSDSHSSLQALVAPSNCR